MILEVMLMSGFLYSLNTKQRVNSRTHKKWRAALRSPPNYQFLAGPLTDAPDDAPKQELSLSEERIREILGDAQTREAFRIQNYQELLSGYTALACASVGVLLYPPLGFLSIPFLIYSTKRFHQHTFKMLKHKKVGPETLISIIMLGGMLVGNFFIASLFCVIIRHANRLVHQITNDSRGHLDSLFEQHTETVWILIDSTEVQIPFEHLKIDDTVIVQSGEMIPADGVIIDGMASVDQHILTGEANPIEREIGNQVFASTMVLSGKIYIRVEKAGQDCTAAKIVNILNQTVDFKSSTQLRAEKISKNLVHPTLIASGLAIPFFGPAGALAVINTHPGNRIMIIAPLTVLNYLNLAANNGILIKDGRSLEFLNQIDTLVFDKTGTLTEEQPHVNAIYCCGAEDEMAVLRYAAAAEHKQKHPLARAILAAAEQHQLGLLEVKNSEYHTGYGMLVHTETQDIYVGSARFMEKSEIVIPADIIVKLAHCYQQAYSLVMVAVNKHLIGAIELHPTVRSEAKQVIAQLKARKNITATYIISGDHDIPTKKLAQELGIDHYFAGVLPTQKADLIDKLKEEGRFICYIGDGINDAIALKKSQVSISLSGASSIATDTAQIVLMDKGLSHLDTLFNLGEDFKRNMDSSLNYMLAPAILGVGGVLFLGFGILPTLVLNLTGLGFCVHNAMHPKLIISDQSLVKKTKGH